MAERRVSVRLGVIGGKEVEATFENLGNRGAGAMKRLGDASEQAFDRVDRGSRRAGGGLQNLGFQVQDFAVQVGNGTSASVALSQQLPQLLGGFGALGAVIGTVVAVGIPLAAYLLGINTNAKTAQEGVDDLTNAIERLKAQQATYSTEGIQAYIEKYGELNAEVLLLIQRQREFAEGEALAAAKTAVGTFQEEITGGFFSGLIRTDTKEIANALGVEYGRAVEETTYEAGEAITRVFFQINPLVREFEDALAAAADATTFEEQAAAVARLSDLIQGTALEGTAFAGTLLDAEAALRELNAQGDGIGGWLGAAIDWASSLAGNLWDGAAAAAAIRDAQAKPPSDEALQRMAYGQGQVAARDAMIADRPIYGGNGNGLSTSEEQTINPALRPRTRPSGGGGARSATSDLEREAERIEREAERIFQSTRTEAELYATELARLNQIKEAGLITNDTYNRQLQDLAERYKQEEDALTSIQTKLEDFVKSSANIAEGIGGALVNAFNAGGDAVAEFVKTGKLDMTSLVTSFIADLARLAAQKFIFGPIANLLSGAIGGLGGGGGIIGQALAGILHDGGVVGSAGGTRSVDPAIFSGARRMHDGGVAGLAGDEVPAILQRGERVLSKQQNAAFERGGAPTINFYVKDAQSVRQSRSQIAADAARAIGMGRRGA